MGDPTDIADPVLPQDDAALGRSRFAHQMFNRLHGLNQPSGFGGGQVANHLKNLVARRLVQRLEGSPSEIRKLQQREAAVAGRRRAGDQTPSLEFFEHTAEITGIDTKIAAEFGRGQRRLVSQLI